MRMLYLECAMGAAGDMLMSSLLELHPEPEDFIRRLNGLGIPGVKVEMNSVTRCGIVGMGVSVLVNGVDEEDVRESHGHDHGHIHSHEHGHHHTGMAEIQALINGLDIPAQVKADAIAVYELIGQAESNAHGRPVTDIHFHEVGTMDAVTDIVGVCLLIHELSPEQILASPIHVGCGQVKFAHGILPVPAPATAYILRGTPTYGGKIDGELCTPTGAALLKHFVGKFTAERAMTVEKIGCGMGKRHFYAHDGSEILSAVRAYIGESGENGGEVLELSCNIDDMTGEELGFAAGKIMDEGALDVFMTPIYMKKSRPGQLLTVLCPEAEAEKFVGLIFRLTTTLGIRRKLCGRYTLSRGVETVETAYGPIRVKKAEGYGVARAKAEYDDLAAAALKHGVTLDEVRGSVVK